MVGNYSIIYWLRTFSVTCVPNVMKIWQCFLELQLKMSGMFFWDTVYNALVRGEPLDSWLHSACQSLEGVFGWGYDHFCLSRSKNLEHGGGVKIYYLQRMFNFWGPYLLPKIFQLYGPRYRLRNLCTNSMMARLILNNCKCWRPTPKIF